MTWDFVPNSRGYKAAAPANLRPKEKLEDVPRQTQELFCLRDFVVSTDPASRLGLSSAVILHHKPLNSQKALFLAESLDIVDKVTFVN